MTSEGFDGIGPMTFPLKRTLAVRKNDANIARGMLLKLSLFDPDRVTGRGDEVHFPVLFDNVSLLEELVKALTDSGCDFHIMEGPGLTRERDVPPTPYAKVLELVRGRIDEKLEGLIPASYEKLGDCLILRLEGPPGPFQYIVGRAYMEATRTRYVLSDAGGVSGELREPRMEVLVPPGDGRYEVVHREGNVRYLLDPRKVMFSSGNISERPLIPDLARSLPLPPGVEASADGPAGRRMEVVVDMFAGIGYFTIPLAKGSDRDILVIAVEKNPTSFGYLVRNIRENKVGERVIPVLGDCRSTLPNGIADRLIAGYLGGTRNYFRTAVELSRPEGSIIHFHDTVEVETGPEGLFNLLERMAAEDGRSLSLLGSRKVKSYAPRIDHVALDLLLGPAE